jgi:hypothetical protein
MQHRSFRLSDRTPVRRQEWVSLSAIALFGVLFVWLGAADADSIVFWLLVPLSVTPIMSGPRPYRIMAAVCLCFLVLKITDQTRREERRKRVMLYDARLR